MSLASLPLTVAAWSVAVSAFALAFCIRPFHPRLLVRALSLVLVLRAYGPDTRWPLVVMDQGIVQKLWSMLVETRRYSPDKLQRLVTSLAPFIADQIVWVAVPPHVAARRIAGRTDGNSRFDRQAPEAIAARLRSLEETYTALIAMFDKAAGLPVARIDGEADLAHNAAIIEELAAGCLRAAS